MSVGLIVFLAIVLGIPALIVLWAIGAYNRLVTLRNTFRNAFAQIDVQLKRRHDLIPNVVETARAYMQHERETLEAVIAARNSAAAARQAAASNPSNAAAIAQIGDAEGALGSALTRFFALSEAYPELKANETMKQLSEELTSTENKVAFSRQAFNDAVMSYNVAIEQFPANILAGLFQFKAADLLQSTESSAERQTPKVSFT
ncbi:MAG TPA: LemA family protein [Burkholderiaceae bacterium]|nr:LemA family protein [Burkholderiaceae bacterium]